ncbi:MAG: hypothetical protein AAFU85_31845 [Planctomycetota bacterium]
MRQSDSQTLERMDTEVLRLEDVSFFSEKSTGIGMRAFSAVVERSEFIHVDVDEHQDPREVCSALVGLKKLVSGKVLFGGHSMLGRDFPRQFRARSSIGRVFAETAWIESLTLGENIRLSLSHQRRDAEEIDRRVQLCADTIGGDSSSDLVREMRKRPSFVDPAILQQLQFVRAFCGDPQLLLLEHPLRYLSVDAIARVARAITMAVSRGAAAIWFGESPDVPERIRESMTVSWNLQANQIACSTGLRDE